MINQEENIYIPPEFKKIAIRVNKKGNCKTDGTINSVAPITFYEWVNKGAVRKKNMYGVLPEIQDLHFIIYFCFYTLDPIFIILEVDERKIKYESFDEIVIKENIEIVFDECNVLFSGDIFSFFREIEKYISKERAENLIKKLIWKADEISLSKTSDLQHSIYYAKIQKRHNAKNLDAIPFYIDFIEEMREKIEEKAKQLDNNSKENLLENLDNQIKILKQLLENS